MMEFRFTEEQEQFRDIVARFCRDKSPSTMVRQLAESTDGFDPAIWRQLCQEIGAVGIHMPEESGGSGFGLVELGIVMEEFGRSLIPVPYLSCGVLACTAIGSLEDPGIRDAMMGQMVAGEKIYTLALDPDHGFPVCDVKRNTDRLSGTLKVVLDATIADGILVLVADGAGAILCLVDSGAEGLKIRQLRTMDGTRRVAAVELAETAFEELGQVSGEQVARLYDTALIALASEMSGGAQALLESAIEYTKLRKQFGRSIASFQAIKHRLADLHVDVELARVAAWQAAAGAEDEAASVNASLAKFVTAETFMQAARETIQLHGGIGFTWENDTHLWYRRAKSSEVFLGTPVFHRERMLREMSV